MANTRYSTLEEINFFKEKVLSGTTTKSRPMFVLDMDGNFAIGYNVTEKGKTEGANLLQLKSSENSENQAIPFGSDIQALLNKGYVEPAIFAAKAMDVRIHPEMARLMNEIAADPDPNRKFDIAILTSRSSDALLKVLQESGIHNPEKLTLVADSGANISVGGEKHNVRSLSTQEQGFLDGIDIQPLETKVNALLKEQGFDPKKRPSLFLEEKGIAKNIHYRAILEYYNQPEGSVLAKAIGSFIKAEMDKYIMEQGPKENDKPVFKTLGGPATVEVKVASVDKGKGLEAIVKEAEAIGYRPSSVVFSGDDASGTDGPAFKESPKLQQQYGIPFYTMHAQHPEGNKLGGTDPKPDPKKSAPEGINPDIILPDPLAVAKLVAEITEQARERAQNPSGNLKEADAKELGVNIKIMRR